MSRYKSIRMVVYVCIRTILRLRNVLDVVDVYSEEECQVS